MLPALAACAEPEASRSSLQKANPLYLDGSPDREVFIDFDKDTESKINGVAEPRDITVDASLEPNQILVHQDKLVIEHIHARGMARQYPVGLGRAGLEFSGEAIIRRKVKWPSWRPTDEMIARNPAHYAKYAGGVPGGRANPLGARALYLYRDGVDTYYRIHGTDAPETIGSYVSNGCIRMLNAHVIDLYDRVSLGTKVRVV